MINHTRPIFDKIVISKTKIIALAVLSSILLVISAKIKIPFYPVPINLQTLFVLLIPLLYGLKIGSLSIFLYLGYGALGLPVFTNEGAGIVYFFGPTGGYLGGFLLATFFVGFLRDRKIIQASLMRLSLVLFAAEVIIFSLGVGWLTNLFGFDKAIQFGLTPFIGGEIFKLLIIVSVYFFTTKLKKEF